MKLLSSLLTQIVASADLRERCSTTRNCKIYIYIYRLVELVESSGATSATSISLLLSLSFGCRATMTATILFDEHDPGKASYQRRIFAVVIQRYAGCGRRRRAGKERGAKRIGQKIEKENRPPQRSAGYITKRVIRQQDSRFPFLA